MLFEDMAEMIGRAPISALDDVTRALWAAVSAAQLSEADALRLSEAIDARRMLSKADQAAAGGSLRPVRHLPPSRKHQRPPDRSEARERSRRWAAAGRMPPTIACKFSSGEQAALAVIAFEVSKRNACDMSIGAIAALAGVSPSTVKRAIRQAKALGLLTIQERRVSRYRNETNIVRIISKTWLSWLELRSRGGVQPRPGTNTSSPKRATEKAPGAGRIATTPRQCPTLPQDRRQGSESAMR